VTHVENIVIQFPLQAQSSRIAVRAEKVSRYGAEDDSLGVGNDCDASGDRVTIHEGRNVDDPVLLDFCRGASVPDVAAGGEPLHEKS